MNNRKKAGTKPLYLDSRQPIEKRVEDLLARMTLEEKISQLGNTLLEWLVDKGVFRMSRFKDAVRELRIGVLHNISSDSKLSMAVVNQVQRYLKEETRLGIPAIITAEGVHGHMSEGATIFPHGLNLASTWNPELVRQVAAVTAREAGATGAHQILAPVLDLSREPRWGRCQENYGEDPYLTGRMGVAFVRGLQGAGPGIGPENCAATPKHFAAHGTPEGGVNLAPVHVGEREVRSDYLPPFKDAICEGGALSIMNCYSEIDGVPCAASRKLLTNILRGEWGFQGYVYSDWGSVEMLHSFHRTAVDLADAGKQALEAGLDLEAPKPVCYGTELLKMVQSGKVSTASVDQAVRRILRLKFLMGLFERPDVDVKHALSVRNTAAHRKLALQAARESIILLKNEGRLLPLSKTLASLAVIGPNADVAQLGNYRCVNDTLVTPLDGIRNKLSPKTEIHHAKGCGVYQLEDDGIADAVDAARKADAVIMVLGESNEVCEEGTDQTNLELPGRQMDLLKAVCAVGKPVVAVLYNGRPLDISWLAENVPAILECWYPGEEGGNALADILFGDCNPSGKLTVSLPRSTGHIPCYYNHKPSARGYYHQPGSPGKPGRDYVFAPTSPLFEFGFGLSYTEFTYRDLKVGPAEIHPAGKVRISVAVANRGKSAGEEVVQVYIRDEVSSVSTPVKALKRFQKLRLAAGEKQTVSFELDAADLALYDINLKQVVEPGFFKVMCGGLENRFEVIA